MRKRTPVFSPEGISINDQLQALHILLRKYRAYTQTVDVTFTWTEVPSHGPNFVRSLFWRTRSLIGPYRTFPLSSSATYGPSQVIFVDDDTDGEPTIGTVAFYDNKAKEYKAFNFDRANMKDLERVNIVVEEALKQAERWKSLGLKNVLSTAEFSARVKNKQSREGHNPPH